MSFSRIFGFSVASRTMLLGLLPFFAITAIGGIVDHFGGSEVNPMAKFILLIVFNILMAAALTGLLLGLIGGFKGDEAALTGKLCSLAHGIVLVLVIGLTALLLF